MKPVPIPDDLSIVGAHKLEISGESAGANDIEALVSKTTIQTPDGERETHVVSVLIECDEVDMRSLHFDQRLWIHFYGAPILPFSLDTAFVSQVADPNDPLTKQLQECGRVLALAWTEHALGTPGGQLHKHLVKLETMARMAQTLDTSEPAANPSVGITRIRVVGDAEVDGRKVGEVEMDVEPGNRAAPELKGGTRGGPGGRFV